MCITLCSAEDSKPHLNGSVDVSEMMDFSIRLHVNSEGKDVVFVLQTIDLPSDKRSGFSYGDQVGYRFKSELIHLFNAETRKNLI